VAKEAAICRKERTVEKLEKTHGDLIRAIDSNDIDLMLKLNNKFHMTFYRDVNMPILQKMIEDLWDRISPYLHILLREGDKVASSKDVIRDHFGMIEGVRKKDPKIVCHWLKADLTEGQYMVENLLKKWDVE
jgi:DNA-binding GntR family transcriptional regulator